MLRIRVLKCSSQIGLDLAEVEAFGLISFALPQLPPRGSFPGLPYLARSCEQRVGE